MSENAATTYQAAERRPGGSGQTRFLSQSVILEETNVPGMVRLAMLIVCAMVTTFIAWATIAEIDEVAATIGEVVPVGAVKQVQHLEGGIIADVLVKEGDLVQAGDVLVRLDGKQVEAELRSRRAGAAALDLEIRRHRAFVDDRLDDFGDVDPQYRGLAAHQRAILRQQLLSRESKAAVLESRIDQRRSDLTVLARERTSLERQAALVAEQLDMRRQLLAKGLVSRIVFLETDRELTRLRGEIERVKAQTAIANQSITEARGRLVETDDELAQDAMKELGDAAGELAQVREEIASLTDRFNRLQITAPVAGVVKGLEANTIGGVIGSGDVVAEIVPIDAEMIVETRISTQDIGHIQIGQDVTVKVTTYDFAKYGGIDGRLEQISASTFEDKEGDTYYTGRISLTQNHVGDDPTRNLVVPGMPVDATIKTGSKSILTYLFKPIHRAIRGAFSER